MPLPPSTDPEHLRKLNALLDAALSLADVERDAWLEALPPDERGFVPQLTSLLARASVESDRFMCSPIALALDGLDEAEPDRAGDIVGPYRLIRELGAGGMATVWLAERTDGLLQRQVALKLPRAGWTTELAQRMAREREILGNLEHPRIARLYDAGVTAAGRPWMAMECIAGAPIDQYCRQHQLDVRARLGLFIQVTEALAHAHARLVVHRDLKPNNILVTPAGEVRLLDFGVAKLLESGLPFEPGITQLMGRAMTPDYASPEQVAGKPLTVATDLYSLGVVLYELLTEQRPYRLARQSAAALEEAILAADVPLASSRIQGHAVRARQLRGDIDTILMKALRKDPARRYASAESFAADLQRHLDGQAVLAQPPSRRYRVRKFIGRHRVAIAAAGTVTASIVFGLGVALWQAGAARSEAARAEQVKDFIASLLKQATPREGGGGVVTASDLLTAAAQRIEHELAANPRAAAELGVIVGQGFFSLGDARKGEATLRAAVARAEQAYGRRHPITLQGKALLVESLNYEDLSVAEQLLDEVVPDALAGLPAAAEPAVFALRSQSFVLAQRGRRDAAYAAARKSIEIGERHLGALHRDTIRTLGLLSSLHGRFGDRAEQLRAATDAMTRARTAFGATRPHPTLAGSERWYGQALIENDRPGEAVPVLTRVLADQRLLDVADTTRVLRALYVLATAQANTGRLDEALPSMREAVALQARLAPDDALDQLSYGAGLLDALVTVRRVDEALALSDHLGALQLPQGDTADDVLARDVARSRILALHGDAGAPRAAAAAAVRAGDARPQRRAEAWLAAACAARLQGHPGPALEFARRALDDPALSTFRAEVQARAAAEAGNAWLELGDFARAEEALARSRRLFEHAQVVPGVRMADTLVGLARLQLRSGRAAEAKAVLAPLAAAWERVNPGSPWHGEALHWLAGAEAAEGRPEAALAHRQAAAAMLLKSALPALRRLAALRA